MVHLTKLTNSAHLADVQHLQARGLHNMAMSAHRTYFASEQAHARIVARDTATRLCNLPDPYVKPATRRLPRPVRALVAFVLLTFACTGYATATAHAAPVSGPDVCYEDEPCFVWHDYGNGSRGVILKAAPRDCAWSDGYSTRCVTVLTACEYHRARSARTIDRKRTESLKGDGWARDHGCKVV